MINFNFSFFHFRCDLWHSFDVLASTASILNLCIISLGRCIEAEVRKCWTVFCQPASFFRCYCHFLCLGALANFACTCSFLLFLLFLLLQRTKKTDGGAKISVAEAAGAGPAFDSKGSYFLFLFLSLSLPLLLFRLLFPGSKQKKQRRQAYTSPAASASSSYDNESVTLMLN